MLIGMPKQLAICRRYTLLPEQGIEKEGDERHKKAYLTERVFMWPTGEVS